MTINWNLAQFVRSAAKPADFPRDGLPQVVFAGRSNVGKSSVINRILNRKNFRGWDRHRVKQLISIIFLWIKSSIW